MDMRYERLYQPGQAPVYPGEPLPQPDPMRSLADWGAPPTPPYRLDDERSYVSPGPPPGPTGWITTDERPTWTPPWVASRPRGVPVWTLVAIPLGVLLIVVAGTLLAWAG